MLDIIGNLETSLMHAGIDAEPEDWLAKTVVYSLSAGLAAFAIFYAFYGLVPALLFGSFALALVPVIRYVLVEMRIEARRSEVEKVLPDLLRVIAANIGAGLTPIVALRTAARPEFGVISKELKYITTRSMSGDSLEQIVKEISARIRSDQLSRVFVVFTTSLRSGGDVIRSLEASASDIQRVREMHDGLVARTSMYTTFVLFGIIITMPFLLAVSINVLNLMGSISLSQQVSIAAAYMDIGFPTVSREVLVLISAVVLVGSSLTASLLIGIINTGNRITGARYFIPILVASLAVFYLSKDVLVPFIIGAIGG